MLFFIGFYENGNEEGKGILSFHPQRKPAAHIYTDDTTLRELNMYLSIRRNNISNEQEHDNNITLNVKKS